MGFASAQPILAVSIDIRASFHPLCSIVPFAVYARQYYATPHRAPTLHASAVAKGTKIDFKIPASDRWIDSRMTSNIEPIAREITRTICHDSEMPAIQIEHWVDLHWQCAAAMLEAGVMDERGEWIEGKDWRRGLDAYRERLLASSASDKDTG